MGTVQRFYPVQQLPYSSPAAVNIKTHQQLLAPLKLRLDTSPDQYQRPSATRHASQRRELQTTDTGQAANYESKINTRNHRHLLTPLDEWSLQATGTNRKPNHHARINLHHQLTRLIMHDINGLWDHMWCEEMLVTSDIHHSKRE